LVAEAGRRRDAGFFEEIEDAVVEPRCLLPDREFFKLVYLAMRYSPFN
jgi:hypothetical protein